MPIHACPHCGTALTSGEIESPFCPTCRKPLSGQVFVEAPPIVLDDEDDDWDRPAGPGRMTGPQVLGWGTVRAGLALVAVGLVFLMAGAWGMWLAFFTNEERIARPFLPETVFVLSLVALAPGVALPLAGMSMGCAAPPASRAKGWAIGFLICLGLAVFLGVLALVGEQMNQAARRDHRDRQRHRGVFQEEPVPWNETLLAVLSITAISAVLVAPALSSVSMQRMARFFGNRSLALAFNIFLVVSLVGGVASGGGLILLSIFMRGEGDVLIGFLALLVGTGICVWHLILVFKLRRTMTKAMLK